MKIEIDGKTVLITRTSLYEGVHYSVFGGPELAEIGGADLYLCAF